MDYEWAKRLCKYAGEDEQYFNWFWNRITKSRDIMEEFTFYRKNGQFLGKASVSGMTLIDVMIWQMDHFKADLDKGFYDMQSNPDKMLLKAFETMQNMESKPDEYLGRFLQDTGTDYPGKY